MNYFSLKDVEERYIIPQLGDRVEDFDVQMIRSSLIYHGLVYHDPRAMAWKVYAEEYPSDEYIDFFNSILAAAEVSNRKEAVLTYVDKDGGRHYGTMYDICQAVDEMHGYRAEGYPGEELDDNGDVITVHAVSFAEFAEWLSRVEDRPVRHVQHNLSATIL